MIRPTRAHVFPPCRYWPATSTRQAVLADRATRPRRPERADPTTARRCPPSSRSCSASPASSPPCPPTCATTLVGRRLDILITMYQCAGLYMFIHMHRRMPSHLGRKALAYVYNYTLCTQGVLHDDEPMWHILYLFPLASSPVHVDHFPITFHCLSLTCSVAAAEACLFTATKYILLVDTEMF